jgi:hypothetical protein
MSPPTTTLARPAHDEDFYAWALDQAERLRAVAAARPNEPIDWELLAEEIEDMGARERRACESFLEHIIAHFLKIEHAADPQPVRPWAKEVHGFRRNLRRRLTRSLENHLSDTLAERYRLAREDAVVDRTDTDPAFDERLPRARPYGFEQLTGTWLPERAAS